MIEMILTVLLLLFESGICATNYIGRHDDATGTDVFIGIPYAQPPTGKLRLQPPVAITADLGDLDVSNFTSNRCYGLKVGAPGLITGSEDCLTLDIVRPSQRTTVHTRQNNKLPIYVFIHGGNFNDGDKSDFDGRNLVQTSVTLGAPFIYVAINYRLSFLGFPSGSQLIGSYNLGLLDQRLALQWVQQEIQFFGGDPTKVVIGGHSSGANSVAYQMMAYSSSTSDGLFRGVILESGSATALSAMQHPDNGTWQNTFNSISTAVGCNTENSLACLQSVPIDNLVTAYTIAFTQSGFVSPIALFSPVVDGHFLASWPSVLLNSTTFANVPSIIRTTTSELVEMIPIYSGIGTESAVVKAVGPNFPYLPTRDFGDILSYYLIASFQNTGPPLSGGQWSRAVAIENDIQMFCPAYTQAVQASTKAPTWKFRWNSVMQSVSVNQWDGVPHESELYYLFPYKGENMATQSAADSILMLSFQRHIITFINTLNPNSLPSFKNTPSVHWPQFDSKFQTRIVYQRPDSSGKALFTEKDNINQGSCGFIKSANPAILRSNCSW